MPTTAWKFAGTGANDATVGAVAWSNPGNITASDDSRAAAALGGGGSMLSNTLRATNFGFTTTDIPSGSTIDGIEVGIERVASDGAATDLLVRLRKTSGQVGDDKATATEWPATEAEALYGGAADTWTASLTDSDVRSSDFGVDLQAQRTAGSPNSQVDAIRVRITYTVSGTTMVADTGSFALSGTAATLLRSRSLAADAGSFALTGTAATLKRGLRLAADAGALTLSGTAVSFTLGYGLTADPASYALTGTAADLRFFRLTADPASYALTGADASLNYGTDEIFIYTGGAFVAHSMKVYTGGAFVDVASGSVYQGGAWVAFYG